MDRWRLCRALGSRVGLYYVGTQLAPPFYYEAGARHVVSGESALLQKAHSGSCRLFCSEVSFTLKQQEMIYYHRFYVESLYPENRRRILRWLFSTFSVYLCEATPAGYKGRFCTHNVRFPKAAFRDLTFSLRGDRSLCLWVISYDLHTLYLERNIYMSMGSGSIDSCLSLWLFKQHISTCGNMWRRTSSGRERSYYSSEKMC